MSEQLMLENNKIEKNYKTFYFKMFIFLAMIFARNVFAAPISTTLLLVVAIVIMAISDRDEIIYFAICMLPVSPAIQHKYVLLFAIIIYWAKYPEDVQFNRSIILLVLLMLWEILHAFGDSSSFSYIEYLRNFAEMMFCTFLLMLTNKKINYEVLYRTFAVCALVMMSIVLLNLLEQTNYDFEKIFTGSYRFGLQEIEDQSFGVSYNQNNLGFICNLAISGLLQLIIHKKQKVFDYLFIGALMFFGFLTMSRAFIICCAFIFVLFVFGKGIKVVAFVKGFAAATFIIFVMYFIMSAFAPFILESISDRFAEFDVSGGRLEILSFYWKHLNSKMKYMFFGTGLQNFNAEMSSVYRIFKVPHNGIQELLVVWGIPGLVFFTMYVYNMIKSARTSVNKFKLANYIPFLLIFLYVQSGQLVRSGEAMLSLAFMYITLCANYEEKENGYIAKNV